jgi:hypothetical protein
MHASISLVAVVVRPEAGPVLERLLPLPRCRVQLADDVILIPAPEETRRRRARVGLERSPSGRIRKRRAAADSGDVPVGRGGRSQANAPAEGP